MSSNRGEDPITTAKQLGEQASYDAERHNSGVVPPTLAALTTTTIITDDPLTLTNVFEASKIKNFLYKVEPNMARLYKPALDLISTTTALFLKSMVEKAVLLEQQQQQDNSRCRQTNEEEQGRAHHLDDADAGDTDPNPKPEHFLITSNHLKRVVSSNHSSLDFLEETYENFKNKDGSVLPSSLKEYIPRVREDKKPQQAKRTANTQITSSGQSESANENEDMKRLKTAVAGTCSSSTFNATSTFNNNNTNNKDASLLLSATTTDDAPLEKAIADAANTKESHILEEIVEDEDDYD